LLEVPAMADQTLNKPFGFDKKKLDGDHLRILMQIRPNALTERGGDTVVMERIAEGLKAAGHHVDVDVASVLSPKDYDLVHLYNFCTPQITESQAKICVDQGVPYVVTTMYEDWPLFFNTMMAHYLLIERYIEIGQPAHAWSDLKRAIDGIAPAGIQDNSYTAKHAAALIGTGTAECNALLRDFPATQRVRSYHCGCDVKASADDGSAFRKEFGINDYVLCVGRLETRKNQLMLMKAMEDSELTLVFATGGFSYQAQYDQAMRRFRRRGRTIFTGKLSSELLASAFAGARVHVLPSFYELPGLVSIEAARYGTNIVVTDWGTIRDYLGEDAWYCNPTDESGIRRAVEQAYAAPRRPRLKERVAQFTWENAVSENLKIYREALGIPEQAINPSSLSRVNRQVEGAAQETTWTQRTVEKIPGSLAKSDATTRQKAEAKCEDGDRIVKSDPAGAIEIYQEAVKLDSSFSRPHRAIGVAWSLLSNFTEAEAYFRTAFIVDPADFKSLTGVGHALLLQNRNEEAFRCFVEAATKKPTDGAILLHLLNASYQLGRFDDVEKALECFLENEPQNIEMTFSLSGIYLKQQRYYLAAVMAERVAALNPKFPDADALKQAIEKAKSESAIREPQVRELSKIDARLQEIELMHRNKQYDEVVAAAEVLLLESLTADESVIVKLVKGEALACKGKLEEAELLFLEGEASQRHAARAIADLGVVAAAREKFAEAEAHFNRSLSLVPTYDIALAGVGLCASMRNDRELAWNYFERALEQNPENVRALFGFIQLGYALHRLPRLETALSKYLDFNPANLSMLYAYAGCLYAQGKRENAEEQLRKILVFEPSNSLAKELLAKIEAEAQSLARARA
jgi:glycosyltransferase involved in cell wall biosynthesis/Flp pilus assembly protein TadD